MFLRCLSSCDLNLSTEQEDTMRTYLWHTILICLIILHKHNSPAMCYRTCRPILYPPNYGMFYSYNYIIHWLTDH